MTSIAELIAERDALHAAGKAHGLPTDDQPAEPKPARKPRAKAKRTTEPTVAELRAAHYRGSNRPVEHGTQRRTARSRQT